MGQANLRRLLAFSAILALGSMSGWTKPALPDRPPLHGALERVSGKSDRTEAEPQTAEEGRKEVPKAKAKGKEPVKPTRGTEAEEEEAPAREEKTDCDDCVIVLPEVPGEPAAETAGASGESGSGHLAGTLWGLFMVARPKRVPRTIIRGVTVP